MVRIWIALLHHKIPRTKLRGIFLLLVFEGTAVCAPLGMRMACCGGDRRLRRQQIARAGAAVAEDKPRPRGADRCGNRKS